VVDAASSILGLAGHREHVIELDCDHKHICKLANGETFHRIARHIKRLADTAIRRTFKGADSRSQDLNEGGDGIPGLLEQHSEASANAVLYSTCTFKRPPSLIGQDDLLEELENWLHQPEWPHLLLHGRAGTGLVRTTMYFSID
jgi:hypothetical protein